MTVQSLSILELQRLRAQLDQVSTAMRMKYLDRALARYPDRSNVVLRSLYRIAAATPAVFVAAPVACPDPVAGEGC